MFKPTLFISLLTYSALSFAGGPLVLGGSAGTTPVTYQNPNITLNIESGNLGAKSNAAADTLVLQALALWNSVSTSNINLVIDQAQLSTVDINLGNFETYLPNTSNTVFNANDNLNPVVYDSNGEIIDAFFGVGQSDNTIGFAASVITIGSRYFDEGYAVINGKDLGLTPTIFKLLIAHEIGHFFGLDHTQVNINNQETDFGTPRLCSTSVQNAYPLMYPFVCRNEETLHQDDISALSALYPSAEVNNDFGVLQGRFVDAAGNAMLGANIWAENTTTGEAISIASDYLAQKNGFYKLYLPVGNYTLHANSLNTLFYAGSGIGPYAKDVSDRSFTSPHPITAVTYQGNTTGNDEIIGITANQTLTIDFANDGKAAVITASAGNDNNGNFGDLFGAMSQTTLLLTATVLMLGRWRLRR